MNHSSPAGDRDRKLRFFRNTASESTRGSMTPGTEQTISEPYAKVNYGTGAERRRAGAENSEIAATARVLTTDATRSIDATCFCELDGATWNVTGNVPWGRRERDITLIRRG